MCSETSGNMAASEFSGFNMADLVKTAHNARLYKEVQNLKKLINELVDFQLEHPKPSVPSSREEAETEKKTGQEIERKEKYIRAQLSIIKSLYRQSVMKVREEKAKTSDDRAVNDALILGLHNLKYEEQSLRSEISAAQHYEYASYDLPTSLRLPAADTSTRNLISFLRKSTSTSFPSTKNPQNTSS
jgi:THO complex subunit 5